MIAHVGVSGGYCAPRSTARSLAADATFLHFSSYFRLVPFLGSFETLLAFGCCLASVAGGRDAGLSGGIPPNCGPLLIANTPKEKPSQVTPRGLVTGRVW